MSIILYMADRIIVIEDKDNNYTTLELSQQSNDNKYIISSSNNENIDTIIKDLNMIREDIHKYNVGDCLSCFCQYNPNRFQCARCNKSINIFNRHRCRVCYDYLCRDCANYADKNLREYREIIFHYIKK